MQKFVELKKERKKEKMIERRVKESFLNREQFGIYY